MADNYSFGRYQVGLNHVGSYQASARPFVKSEIAVPASGASGATAVSVDFPSVTKFVTVRCDGDDAAGKDGSCIRVGFNGAGLGDTSDNFVRVYQSASFSADFRVTKVFLMSDTGDAQTATVIAGLTNIPEVHLSGNWAGQVGVGGTS